MSDIEYTEYKQLGTSSIYSYVIYCFLFFLLKSRLFPQSNETHNYSWITAYILIFFIILFMMNISIFSNKMVCGEPQFSSALTSTLYPIVFIFVLTTLLIEVFPGWLRVFTNSFGMGAAYMFGIRKILKDIFTESNKQHIIKNKNLNTTSLGNSESFQFMKSIEMIYNDPIPVINEIDLTFEEDYLRIKVEDLNKDNDDAKYFVSVPSPERLVEDENGQRYKEKKIFKWSAWEMLKEKSIIPKMSEEETANIPDNLKLDNLKNKLKTILNIKRDVGYFIWYLLVGIITVQASTNTVLSESCVISKSNIDKSYTNFVKSVKT